MRITCYIEPCLTPRPFNHSTMSNQLTHHPQDPITALKHKYFQFAYLGDKFVVYPIGFPYYSYRPIEGASLVVEGPFEHCILSFRTVP